MKWLVLMKWQVLATLLCSAIAAPVLHGQSPSDTVAIHLNDVDLKSAVQLLSQYLDRPIVLGNIAPTKVTLETPKAIRRDEVIGLLRAALESQNMELLADSAHGPYRIAAKNSRSPQPVQDAARRAPGSPTELFVIHLRHARAPDVAATVNALYGRASALGEKSAPVPTLAQQLTQNQIGMQPTLPQGSGAILGGRPATLTGETTIVPDPGTNSLLIRATHADYDLIAAAVKELDVRPLQVLIEVLIAEVRRDKSLSFGLDVSLPGTTLPGHPGTTIDGSQTGIGLGDLVLHVMGVGGDRDLQATLRAAASKGEVQIVSRPAVIAVNNERAEINVGSQRPFVEVSRSLPTDTPSRDQVVQYKDVGTKLSVRPTISADGYVMLQVTQEVSAATTETAFDAPVISTRSVQTQLLLKDGQTVVIGGLTDRQHEVTQAGVPVLSSIPLIGGFFGHLTHSTTETELFLFITPRVVRDDDDAERITKPLVGKTGVDPIQHE